MSVATHRAFAGVSLLLGCVLWLWPLAYLVSDDQCGADIGIGLFGFPLTMLGIIGCGVVAIRCPRDRVSTALCVLGASVGLLSVGGLVWNAFPYDAWIDYAVAQATCS